MYIIKDRAYVKEFALIFEEPRRDAARGRISLLLRSAMDAKAASILPGS